MKNKHVATLTGRIVFPHFPSDKPRWKSPHEAPRAVDLVNVDLAQLEERIQAARVWDGQQFKHYTYIQRGNMCVEFRTVFARPVYENMWTHQTLGMDGVTGETI